MQDSGQIARDSKGRFPKGRSPNPGGKPKVSMDADGLPQLVPLDRHDGWGSFATGIGTPGKDKRIGHTFKSHYLSYEQIARLWDQDDVAAKAIELPAATCFQEGYEIVIGNEGKYQGLKEAVEDELQRLGVDAAIERAMNLERAFGGGAILVGADDGRPLSEPLDLTRVKSLDWLNVLEPIEIIPAGFYMDPAKPKYGEVEYYKFTNYAGVGVPVGDAPKAELPPSVLPSYIHESRLIIFRGIKVSRYYMNGSSATSVSPYWGTPAILRFIDTLRDFNISWASAGIIATDFAQTVISIDGLWAMVKKDPGKIHERLAGLELMRSTARATVVDSDKESVKRESTTLTGFPDLLDRLSQRCAAAVGIPLSILLGYSPASLGSPSDAETKQWHGIIRAIQTRRLTPILRFLITMIMNIERKRKLPKSWKIRWNELEHQTDAQRAESRLTQARADSMYCKMGAVFADEIRKSRFAGGFSFETQIDESKKAPGVEELLPPGVKTGQPGAPGTPAANPNAHDAHVVHAYKRGNPKEAPGAGPAAKEGGDVAPADNRDSADELHVDGFAVCDNCGDLLDEDHQDCD